MMRAVLQQLNLCDASCSIEESYPSAPLSNGIHSRSNLFHRRIVSSGTFPHLPPPPRSKNESKQRPLDFSSTIAPQPTTPPPSHPKSRIKCSQHKNYVFSSASDCDKSTCSNRGNSVCTTNLVPLSNPFRVRRHIYWELQG